MTREEAIKHGKEQLEIFGGTHREFIEMSIKALEQEPKTGHKVSGDLLGGLYCSECMTYVNEYFNYCPNCGCRMVEPQESEDKE